MLVPMVGHRKLGGAGEGKELVGYWVNKLRWRSRKDAATRGCDYTVLGDSLRSDH